MLHHESVANIIDVLGGAGEMNEFGDPPHLNAIREALPEPVFERFDVVIGARLDVLDLLGVGFGETGHDCIKERHRVAG
jgi:hypothetical protein